MIERFEKLFGVAFLLSALLGIPATIVGIMSSPTVAFISLGSFAALLLLFSPIYFFPSLKQWATGYPRYSTKSLMIERDAKITVDQDYKAVIKKKSVVLYYSEPKQNDRIDYIDSLPGFDPKAQQYSSPDSTISSLRSSDGKLRIYWEPKRIIKAGIPYTHKQVHASPCIYGYDSFYHEIYFDRSTSESRLEIITSYRLEEAIGFFLPWYRRGVSTKLLFYYYLLTPSRNCEQPIIDSDDKRIRWTLYQPKIARSYVLFAIFCGERDVFLREQWAAFNGWQKTWARLRFGRLLRQANLH